ncbi:MAG: Clp protease N-terminal domain-containing protein [Streptosporangiaceae bacterium]
MPEPEPSGPYLEAMQRAFQFAHDLGRGCGPVEFLVGIAGGSGTAAAALQPDGGRSVRAVASAAGGTAEGAGYLHMQAQEAAVSLAAALGQPPGPEHLLIALLDQGTPGVAETLSRAGLEPATVRQAALAGIGAPADLPSLTMPALAPAGSMDRPPLAVSSLDARAWAVLRWRQDHLPLGRLRRAGDREALYHLERDAASRLASQLGLDDDQRYSIVHQHGDRVQQLVTGAHPGLARPGHPGGRRPGAIAGRRRPRRWLTFTVGWGVWFGNRWVNLRDRWFRVRTIRYYRGVPQP